MSRSQIAAGTVAAIALAVAGRAVFTASAEKLPDPRHGLGAATDEALANGAVDGAVSAAGLDRAPSFADGADAVPRAPRGKLSDRIPDVLLTSHEGKPVRFFEDVVKDRKIAVNFMYTVCKGICPGMTRNIKVVRQRLAEQGRDDYLFVSVSIEPDQDTPAQMARYMAVNGIENKPGVSPWIFLTGRIEDIDAVRRSLGVYELDPVLDADRTQHGGILTFGNDKSDWWGAAAALSNPESIQRTMLRLTGDDHRGLPRLAAASPPEA